MAEQIWRRWGQLVPWDVIVAPDGQLWTIMPGARAGQLTAICWATWERRQFAPDPNGPVLTHNPTMPEAVTQLMSSFPGSIILEGQADGQPLTIGPRVLDDVPALVRHLLAHHGTPAPHARHAQEFGELARYHDVMHRQSLVYPSRVPHWHAPAER